MFGLIPLGIAHTLISLVAIVSGIWSLIRYKEIVFQSRLGKIYLLTTAITALTAFGIFEATGKAGVGHGLAVLTLLAIAGGTLVAVTDIFGRWSRLLQALCFSSTILFHLVPGVTEALTRLPLGHPLVNREQPAIFIPIYAAMFLVYFIAIGVQLRWIWIHSIRKPVRAQA